MDYEYEIENVFPEDLTYDEIQRIICMKIASIIIKEENDICKI